MIRGFAVGSFVLIVMYVAFQPGASSKTEQAGNVLVAGMRRLLSPQVAGIGDHTKSQTPPTAKGGGGGGVPKFT